MAELRPSELPLGTIPRFKQTWLHAPVTPLCKEFLAHHHDGLLLDVHECMDVGLGQVAFICQDRVGLCKQGGTCILRVDVVLGPTRRAHTMQHTLTTTIKPQVHSVDDLRVPYRHAVGLLHVTVSTEHEGQGGGLHAWLVYMCPTGERAR